jgi:hypothetical protein
VSRGCLVGLMLTVVVMLLVYSFLKDRFVDDSSPEHVSPVDEAVVAKCLGNQRALRAAITGYTLAHGGRLPETLEELVPRFLAVVPHCPSGARYEYDPRNGTVRCSAGHGE